MIIVIGGDSAGKPLADVLAAHLAAKGYTVIDLGQETGELYASLAERGAKTILSGQATRGILCCGTGIGVAISANKVPGIRAAQVHDTYSAERAAKSNNAQIITLGARVVGAELAKVIAETFLASDFDPQGSSAANVAGIDQLDRTYARGGAAS